MEDDVEDEVEEEEEEDNEEDDGDEVEADSTPKTGARARWAAGGRTTEGTPSRATSTATPLINSVARGSRVAVA